MTAEANPQPNAPPSPGGSDAGPRHDGERAIHRRLGLDETVDPIFLLRSWPLQIGKLSFVSCSR
jgi:hypothetical protein